ncbi:MAG: T9SS type A sorting domain-containing protein, partial [Rhodothermales bacterium]
IKGLKYRLNSAGSRGLTVRQPLQPGQPPSNQVQRWRRLAATGDFNADIPIEDLRPGDNRVELIAEDNLGNIRSVTVTLTQETGTSPLPYAVDWSTVSDPQDVGQYVDGKWTLEDTGLRIREMGYDRIFLLGETAWQDYEITVPVTIHKLDTATYVKSGVGFIMRFTGHVVGGHRNFPETQPKYGYQPLGGIGWLRWDANNQGQPRKQFFHGDYDVVDNFGKRPIEFGATYIMKMRAETLPDAPNGDGVTTYSWKAWRAGTAEPPDWDWTFTQTSEYALRRGGVALLSHFADVTFGDITITPRDTEAPSISNTSVEPSQTMASISWTTDEPSIARIDYGLTEEYGSVFEGEASETEHLAQLEDLVENTTYYYQITATDPSGNATTTTGSFMTSGETSLPVELVQFDAVADKGDVHLSWQTTSETSNAGFEVQHRRGEATSFVQAGFVQGAGTTTEAQRYRYRLEDLPPGRHAFRLKQVDFDGSVQYSNEVAVEISLPTRYHLSGAYPNPFNPQTQFELVVREAQRVRAEVYNILGQRVAVLHDGEVQGSVLTRLTFEADGLASGSYMLRVQGEAFAATRRMTLVK